MYNGIIQERTCKVVCVGSRRLTLWLPTLTQSTPAIRRTLRRRTSFPQKAVGGSFWGNGAPKRAQAPQSRHTLSPPQPCDQRGSSPSVSSGSRE